MELNEGFYSKEITLTAAQRKKLKKKQQQYLLETEIQKERLSSMLLEFDFTRALIGADLNKIEYEAISHAASAANLKIFKILGDGNCLFRAIQHQLKHVHECTDDPGVPLLDHESLRKMSVQCLLKNRSMYEVFVVNSEDSCTDEDAYMAYCKKMAKEGEWGGDIEIKALSQELCCSIAVYTDQPQPIVYGNENCKFTLNISFHKHAYAIGGHYNSLVILDHC
ncbi:bifunctional OTU domain/Papain-like cysteine peptidase superfamily [Babesia duncani]|uniref:Bifunctional OTU domain/Papain-like cysteine peptidase superfamily n=1 Tax=Babesia duncani TaxID=323732 RepID=A0AAD9UN03_9APIC|nr:bifunctional OTU domain/Papain-like cysteine peptidase superfamily [Babesia duncani]